VKTARRSRGGAWCRSSPAGDRIDRIGGIGAPTAQGYSEAFYARFHYGWSELRAVRTERYHFIEAPRPSSTTWRRPRRDPQPGATERRTVARSARRWGRSTGDRPGPGRPRADRGGRGTLRKLSALATSGRPPDRGQVVAGPARPQGPDPRLQLMDRAREEASRRTRRGDRHLERDPAGRPEVIEPGSCSATPIPEARLERAADYYRKTWSSAPTTTTR